MFSTAGYTIQNGIYPPLQKLATCDRYAKELVDKVSPELVWLNCGGNPYLLRGQACMAWDFPLYQSNPYLKRFESTFVELGAARVGVKTVEPVAYDSEVKLSAAVTGIFKKYDTIWLYSPRAVAFHAFIDETPLSLKFQQEIGLSVPISLPTAFKYAGLTREG
jgi:hypothetical protein